MLFDAGSAALELLNISKDYELVHYHVEKKENEAVVSISYPNRDGTTNMVNVTMWQPYGKDGIWIPNADNFSDENGLSLN